MSVKMQASIFLLFLAFLAGGQSVHKVHADEDQSITVAEDSQDKDFDDFMGLLEFLGEWETEKGKLLYPEDLDKMPLNNEENRDGKKD